MADLTNTQTGIIPPTPPVVLGGQELYDFIMGAIEPDLLSTNVGSLVQKYANQTDAEREERAVRYRNAFDEYERRLQQYQKEWDEQLRTYKRLAISYIEHESQNDESAQLEEIESSFDV